MHISKDSDSMKKPKEKKFRTPDISFWFPHLVVTQCGTCSLHWEKWYKTGEDWARFYKAQYLTCPMFPGSWNVYARLQVRVQSLSVRQSIVIIFLIFAPTFLYLECGDNSVSISCGCSKEEEKSLDWCLPSPRTVWGWGGVSLVSQRHSGDSFLCSP